MRRDLTASKAKNATFAKKKQTKLSSSSGLERLQDLKHPCLRPDPGLMTNGGVWPLPWTINYGSNNLTISPLTFTFTSKVGTCEVIDKAMARYQKIAFAGFDPNTYQDSGSPQITSLVISVDGGCDNGYPQLEMDEAYSISVSSSSQLATLQANQVWGALRGLETFSQLVFQPTFNKVRENSMKVRFV